MLYFERDGESGFRPASSYAEEALATANTHDMPTLAGFWRAHDVAVRRKVGLIESDDEERAARATRDVEKRQLVERLIAEGVLPEGEEPDDTTLRAAVHEFLCRTPSALVGFSLDDIVGEEEPVNVPGVGADKFPSWTRRLALSVENFPGDPAVAASLRCSRAKRGSAER